MYSNFVQNISSLEWSALTGTTNYFILSKDSMIRLAELLGEDYELVSGTGEDHLLVVPGSTTGSLPGMDFHMICKKDNSNVGFYFITYNNSNNSYTMLCVKTPTGFFQIHRSIASSYTGKINTMFIRNVNPDLLHISFSSKESSYSWLENGEFIIANGKDLAGNVQPYFLGRYQGTITYRSFDNSIYGTQTMTAGYFNRSSKDFIGLQKLALIDPGITFDDVYTVTHTGNEMHKVIEMNGNVYAIFEGYLTGLNIYQLAVKC